MRVVVVGGGIGGAAAARSLSRAGAEVVLLEGSEMLGGLVTSFEVGGTPIERFYHHVFPHETAIISLITELGLADRLQWFRSSVGVLAGGTVWPFTTPLDLLRFRALPRHDRLRMGLGALRLGRDQRWEPLDDRPALDWVRSAIGPAATSTVWEPLLEAKFGSRAADVPASWLWARFRQRAAARKASHGGSERLGYLRGGFRRLFDALAADLAATGVDLRLGCPATAIGVDGSRVTGVVSGSSTVEADAVVFAGALPAIRDLLPSTQWHETWATAEGMAVACVVLECDRALVEPYWTNVCDPAVPFGGLIEHTNLVPPSDYGGRHVIYLGRYVAPGDEGLIAGDDLDTRWLDALVAAVPALRRPQILASHVFRARYAAPVVSLGQRHRVPPLEAHLGGLYLATTAQIHPQDRGMDEGVRLGVRAADRVLRR